MIGAASKGKDIFNGDSRFILKLDINTEIVFHFLHVTHLPDMVECDREVRWHHGLCIGCSEFMRCPGS